MKRNIIETVMGGVVLVIAAAFVAFAFNASGLRTVGGYSVSAVFDDASGISPGADVRMSGVKVGTVTAQELDPNTFFAEVTLSIEDRIQLPDDTSARIVPEGLLGGNYIELQPGGALENLQPGGRIEYTQGAINVVDLLGRFIFGGSDSGGSQPSGGGGGFGPS
ncbi:outer membrane lipid asymmetry maintenance protein MlaD [Algihabitans sp.]|uniref:outer membrane lipid asymmetry maintenance protein MlaD n=1 Tax=Algihabitans sp. TaxID=2821514 RepID=UPI003BAAACC1